MNYLDNKFLDYKFKSNICSDTIEFEKCKIFGYDCLMTELRVEPICDEVKRICSRSSDNDNSLEVTLEDVVWVNHVRDYVLNIEDYNKLDMTNGFIEFDEERDLESG